MDSQKAAHTVTRGWSTRGCALTFRWTTLSVACMVHYAKLKTILSKLACVNHLISGDTAAPFELRSVSLVGAGWKPALPGWNRLEVALHLQLRQPFHLPVILRVAGFLKPESFV
jgi:hypothetical protein